MGFADELRNEPNRKKQEELLKENQDWLRLKTLFVDYIKSDCKYWAGCGKSSCRGYLGDYVKRLEEEYTSQFTDSCNSDKIVEIEFYNSPEGLMWECLRSKFYHYICEEKQKYSEPYPNSLGMSKGDAEKLLAFLKEELEREGLKVESELRKEFWKVHYEDKYVPHTSKIERMLTGTDGHYEKREVIDEQMYSFYITISW